MNLNLKGYRAAMGLNQKQFAERIGMKQSTYSMKEEGNRKFSPNEMLLITKMLRVEFPEANMETIFFR